MAALDRVRTLLRCLAADPRLGGVLFYDLDPFLLPLLARRLAEAVPGDPATVPLGPGAGDDGLWVRTRLTGDVLRLEPGPLAADAGAVVLVPDLGQADPVVARTVVTMAGADAASVETQGFSRRWRPRTWWIAAVPRADVANLSAHLLDRFPIRVDAGGLYAEWTPLRDAAAWTTREDEEAALLRAFPPLPAPNPDPGRPPAPPPSPGALRRVVELLPPGPSRRRDLALARVARTLAGFDGAARTDPDHVDRAAELLGVRPPRVPDPAPPPPPPRTAGTDEAPATRDPSPHRPSAPATAGTHAPETSGRTGPPVVLPPPADDTGPYLEDAPDALPRLGALRIPAGRRTRAARWRGRPLGVRPASDPRDLAVVATVLEAAKYQPVRRRNRPRARPGMLISPADLRSPRRQAEPGAGLVLVLDHSCWWDWDRARGLAGFLREAYRDDASVSVIEFGHRDNPAELSAVRYRVRTLLDPRVLRSLEREPGRATPLAHGLELAVTELRGLLRRGPMKIALVVATDGRGNVPLSDSLLGEVRRPVGARGVRSALDAAAPLRTLPGVRPVVLAPDTGRHDGLPFDLANAMGGTLILVPRRDDGDGDS
ncbi:magnesium chelatase [Actinomadura sp. WMMB 499]|uniref:magnesium chelatase n=1 Tax=Actinomadura sp. WMMB 499 TaxID=1219491 RepID=UPI00124761AE|nr:magnesium chelatase [Actinomadura sp. WMMB 499]QFG22997.1 magnesium chelatase [Actinomadura sp. WMMB 499]